MRTRPDTEPFRTAVVLVDVMQLSYEEAATSLDCRIGTVKSRVNRGRLAFRDAYVRVSGPQHGRGHVEPSEALAPLRQVGLDGPVLQELGAVMEDAAKLPLIDDPLGERHEVIRAYILRDYAS